MKTSLNSIEWLNTSPKFNATATLALQPFRASPSGRKIAGGRSAYAAAYDDFIVSVSEALLGTTHAYGHPVIIPNNPYFSIENVDRPSIRVELALPAFIPIDEEAEKVCKIWGKSPWSHYHSDIEYAVGPHFFRECSLLNFVVPLLAGETVYCRAA